jgi:hypothetical protein
VRRKNATAGVSRPARTVSNATCGTGNVIVVMDPLSRFGLVRPWAWAVKTCGCAPPAFSVLAVAVGFLAGAASTLAAAGEPHRSRGADMNGDRELPSDGDWIAPTLEEPGGTIAAPSAPRSRFRLARADALLTAGIIAGSGSTLAVAHTSSDPTASVSATGTSDSGADSSAPDDAAGGFGGGLEGEQRLRGTLTPVGSSTITVKTSSGTETYEVTDTTEIVKDGVPATLSQLTTGEAVLVHVYPSTSGSEMLVERVFAGTLPNFGGHGGPRRDSGSDAPGDSGSGTSDSEGAGTTSET